MQQRTPGDDTLSPAPTSDAPVEVQIIGAAAATPDPTLRGSIRPFSYYASVSAFPEELNQAPKSWADRAYPKLFHYNRLPKGGHFAAFEQPESLVDELRTAFRSFR